MVGQFAEWISRIVNAWKFWVIVAPWEVGILVRLGYSATRLEPGPHWRIPFVDSIILVNTRLRVTSIPTVTIATARRAGAPHKHVKCRKAIIGYSISDPLIAVQAYEHPAVAVQGVAQAEIAKALTSEQALKVVTETFKPNGVAIEFLQYVEDVDIPGLRLLQESWVIASEHYSDKTRSHTHY